MAQGQRAGLITPRSLDRDELPVYNHLVALQKLLVIKSDVKHNTGIAQRQSVSNTVLFQQDMQMSEFEDGYRLISGRSQDRNLLPVSTKGI